MCFYLAGFSWDLNKLQPSGCDLHNFPIDTGPSVDAGRVTVGNFVVVLLSSNIIQCMRLHLAFIGI